MKSRVLYILPFIVFIGVFILAVLSPTYLDEIFYFNTKTQAINNNNHSLPAYIECAAESSISIASLLLPAAYLSHLIGLLVSSPFELRILGVLFSVINVILLIKIANSLHEDKISRNRMRDLVIYCHFLGVFPFLAVLARPETLVTFLCLLLISLALYQYQNRSNGYGLEYFSVSLLLISMMFWVHPLAIIYVFVCFSCQLIVSREKKKVLFLFFAIITGVILTSVHFNARAIECDAVPSVNQFFSTISGGLLGGNIRELDVLALIEFFLFKLTYLFDFAPYLIALIPRENYWFGVVPKPDNVPIYFYWLIIYSLGISFCILFLLFLVGIRGLIRSLKIGQLFQQPIKLLALASILGIIINTLIFQLKYPYRTVSILPLILLFLIFTLTKEIIKHRWFSITLTALKTAIVISSTGVFVMYLRPVLLSLEQPNPQDQPLSVGLFSSEASRVDITKAIRECYIEIKDSDYFLVDTSTYFTFKGNKGLYILSGGQISDKQPEEYLRSIGARGIFARCNSVPLEYRGVVKRVGNFCCWKANR